VDVTSSHAAKINLCLVLALTVGNADLGYNNSELRKLDINNEIRNL